jgi:hypothetical protein
MKARCDCGPRTRTGRADRDPRIVPTDRALDPRIERSVGARPPDENRRSGESDATITVYGTRDRSLDLVQGAWDERYDGLGPPDDWRTAHGGPRASDDERIDPDPNPSDDDYLRSGEWGPIQQMICFERDGGGAVDWSMVTFVDSPTTLAGKPGSGLRWLSTGARTVLGRPISYSPSCEGTLVFHADTLPEGYRLWIYEPGCIRRWIDARWLASHCGT